MMALREVVARELREAERQILARLYERLKKPTPHMLQALAREKRLYGASLTIEQAWAAMVEAAFEEPAR